MGNDAESASVVPSAVRVGSPQFERSMIADQQQRHWTGERWTAPGIRAGGRLFISAQHALVEMHRLQMLTFGSLPRTTWRAAACFDLWLPARVSPGEIKQWLYQHTKLIIDTTAHGSGPTPASYVAIRVDYGALVEVTRTGSDVPASCAGTARPRILSLIDLGSPEEPAWAIADQWLEYWTGSSWTEQKQRDGAFVWAEYEAAATEARRLLVVEDRAAAMRKYQAPLHVEMYAPDAVPLRTLQSWLMRTTTLLVDAPATDHGRLAGMLGFGRVTFSTLTATCGP